MSHQVLFHCACAAPLSVAKAPAGAGQHHTLSSLLFCEECDAVRCNACVASEVALFYCPSCLFEVPSASVRSEKSRQVGLGKKIASGGAPQSDDASSHRRCARNCFQCPQCDNTLKTVASDSEPSTSTSLSPTAYYLECSYCLWDSKQVGMSFEKPTGLAREYFHFQWRHVHGLTRHDPLRATAKVRRCGPRDYRV